MTKNLHQKSCRKIKCTMDRNNKITGIRSIIFWIKKIQRRLKDKNRNKNQNYENKRKGVEESKDSFSIFKVSNKTIINKNKPSNLFILIKYRDNNISRNLV